MKLSTLIKKLEKIKAESGDLVVRVPDGYQVKLNVALVSKSGKITYELIIR